MNKEFLGRSRSALIQQGLDKWRRIRVLYLAGRPWPFVTAFGAMILGIGLALPKIWRASPPGFLPPVKISALDWAEAASLKRTARSAFKSKRFYESRLAWLAAASHNPADPQCFRGLLRVALANPPKAGDRLTAVWREAYWLLRLSQTNRADCDLLAKILARNQRPEQLVGLLSPFEKGLTRKEKNLLLPALFDTGRLKKFAQLRAGLTSTEKHSGRLLWYGLAFEAGWGPPSRRYAAQIALQRASPSASDQALVHHLLLAVSFHALDESAYSGTLRWLVEHHRDLLEDHLNQWRLLNLLGERARARSLAGRFHPPVTTDAGAAALAKAWEENGLSGRALRFLQHRLASSRGHWRLWQIWADLLIQTRQWDALRSLALEIRNRPQLRDLLRAYSFYLEGRAYFGMGNAGAAAAAYAEIPRSPTEICPIYLSVARQLLGDDQAALATRLLDRCREALGTREDYWTLDLRTACRRRDGRRLLEAARQLKRREPKNPVVLGNYAAALVMNGIQPAESLRLSLELLLRFPGSLDLQLIRCLALIEVKRFAAARIMLELIPRKRLTRRQAANYSLACLLVYCHKRQFDKAREMEQQIDKQMLYPHQLTLLQRTLIGLGKNTCHQG